MTQNRILVIRGGAIGDFILTLPVLAALRQQFPRTRLELLGYPHIAQLARAGGLVDAVRSIEAGPLAGFFARDGDLDADLQDYFSEFALIISFLYDPDEIFRMNIARCSEAQFVRGPHRPDDQAGVHATKVLLKPLERLAIFDADTVPRLVLEPPTNANGSCEAFTLALHPGSGSEGKNWPESKWAVLLNRLIETTPWQLLLVGGEAEGTKLDRLAAVLPAARTRIARSLPLTELAQQLSGCDGFVGHDSGISHLAAALGVPTLVLWGESVEAVWRPQGRHVSVLRHVNGLNALPSEVVLEQVRRLATE